MLESILSPRALTCSDCQLDVEADSPALTPGNLQAKMGAFLKEQPSGVIVVHNLMGAPAGIIDVLVLAMTDEKGQGNLLFEGCKIAAKRAKIILLAHVPSVNEIKVRLRFIVPALLFTFVCFHLHLFRIRCDFISTPFKTQSDNSESLIAFEEATVSYVAQHLLARLGAGTNSNTVEPFRKRIDRVLILTEDARQSAIKKIARS